VDFAGRQALGHPVLFSGCCTLFRLDALAAVGGFTSGHLTEDLDLTNRLWLAGWRGVYAGHVQNWGELPFTYDDYRRQQERWAAGSARALREFLIPLLTSRNLTWMHKLSAIRQNAYFATTIFTGAALVLAVATILWLAARQNTYSAELYLYVQSEHKAVLLALTYWCVLSNLVEPLVMILVHKRSPRDLLHVPVMIWYTWSVVPTYVVGNLKGLLRADLRWFHTPKFVRGHTGRLPGIPTPVRLFNLSLCLVLFALYFTEGWLFGWFDEFALLLLPAFLIVLRSTPDARSRFDPHR
jgi:hypothetical protein